MYPLISYYLLLLVKYFLLFFYFYFVGRGVLLLINKTISNNKNTTKDIMFVKKEIYSNMLENIICFNYDLIKRIQTMQEMW